MRKQGEGKGAGRHSRALAGTAGRLCQEEGLSAGGNPDPRSQSRLVRTRPRGDLRPQGARGTCLACGSASWSPGCSVLPSQASPDALGTQLVVAPATRRGGSWTSGSQPWSGPVLAAAAVWELIQRIEEPSLSLLLFSNLFLRDPQRSAHQTQNPNLFQIHVEILQKLSMY